MEACAECSRNCSMIHRKHNPAPIVFSFFKVMYGKHFDELLTVPPRFTRLASLVGKKTYLEDSNGQKWNVVLSDVSGCLAFQKGWNEFCLDHGIELGDFVVFHYIRSSHFAVQIFGRNGCERLSLSVEKNNQNKRAKITQPLNDSNRPCRSVFEEPKEHFNACSVSQPEVDVTQRKDDSTTSQCNGTGRAKVAATADSQENLYMSTRDTSFTTEDDRACLVGSYKKVNADKASEVQVEGNRSSEVFGKMQTDETVATSNDVKKCHIAEASTVASSKCEKEDMARKEFTLLRSSLPSIDMLSSSNIPPKPHTPDLSTLLGGRTRLVNQEVKFSQHFSGSPAEETSLHASRREANVSNSKNVKSYNGELRAKNVKSYNGELGDDSNHMMKDKRNILGTPERVDFCDSSSALIIKITCSVKPDSESFLELPERLPIIKPSSRRGANLEQKLVFLRDPARRLWPVVYHETEKTGLKVLASGWKQFRKANSIQPGQKCTFVVENIYEAIFQVRISS